MTRKILLLCAAGMSTGILLRKLQRYAQEQKIDVQINANGLTSNSYLDAAKNADVILLGPQVSFRIAEIKKATNKPIAAIPAVDYALGNAAKIFKTVNQLLDK